MTVNEISFLIRKAIFKVYSNLGPGLFESVYEKALMHELQMLALEVKNQVALPFIYETLRFDAGYRMDLLVNEKVVVEVKSIEAINDVHHKQMLTYLKLSGRKLGILVNFTTGNIEGSIIRKINGTI
jgi:GxxExxY protein